MIRSELVYLAKKQMPNLFELTRMTTLLARASHRGNTRMAKTINHALLRIGLPDVEFIETEQALEPPIAAAPGESEGEQ